MSRGKARSVEQIIRLLKDFELKVNQGQSVASICKEFKLSESTYYKYKQQYGGMEIDHARRLKELEKENQRLKRAVADLTLDKQILKDAAEGNF